MNNANFVAIHNAIKLLQDRAEAGLLNERAKGGICSTLTEILETEMFMDSDELFVDVYQWFEDWPERSGNGNFPVSHATLNPAKAFYDAYDAGTMWTGEYGAARKRLLAYIEKRAHFAAYLN